MKVFISWSGELSHKVALALHDWLPCVLNEAKPFVSSEDIRKGNRWLLDVSKELATTRFGIICLTPDNLNAPWILFEAGALSKSLKDSQVCTLLLGQLKPTDVKGPLAGFQHTIFKRDDFKKLVKSVNSEIENNPLPEAVVSKVFDKWWPDLESNISKNLAADPVAEREERSESDMLKEILELSRSIARHTRGQDDEFVTDLYKMRQLLRMSISELGLSRGTLQLLLRRGIRTIGPLSERTEIDLRKSGISEKCITEIRSKLENLGLSLGMSYQNDLFEDILHSIKPRHA